MSSTHCTRGTAGGKTVSYDQGRAVVHPQPGSAEAGGGDPETRRVAEAELWDEICHGRDPRDDEAAEWIRQDKEAWRRRVEAGHV